MKISLSLFGYIRWSTLSNVAVQKVRVAFTRSCFLDERVSTSRGDRADRTAESYGEW